MKLKKYKSTFEYIQEQVALNEKKLSNVFIKDYEIDALAALSKAFVPKAKFGVCHGARNGYEVKALRDRLGYNIIGTDISQSVLSIPNMICWDFHSAKPEWLGQVDFIYSNSLDHSHNPKKCVASWMSCLTRSGICVVSWTIRHVGNADGGDCFSATKAEYSKMLGEIGRLVKTVSINDVRDTTLFVLKRGKV
jgi:hypothetical protein